MLLKLNNMKEELDIIYKELNEIEYALAHNLTESQEISKAWRTRLVCTKDAIIIKIMEKYEQNNI